MSATANVVIIAAIITKVGPSTHDVRHQATLGLLPRSLVTAITSCMLMSLSVRQRPSGVTRTVLWMRTQFLHINRRSLLQISVASALKGKLSRTTFDRLTASLDQCCRKSRLKEPLACLLV